jgi:hypothetical protein
MDARPNPAPLEEATAPATRERPRLVTFRFLRTPSGRCRAEVKLSWAGGSEMVGTAAGVCSPEGELRCAAEACLQAIHQGVPDPALDLVGVKALRAFDTTLVVASVAIRGGHGGPRLVGSVLAERDPVPAAARAVLHAVNRIITKGPSGAPRNGNGPRDI